MSESIDRIGFQGSALQLLLDESMTHWVRIYSNVTACYVERDAEEAKALFSSKPFRRSTIEEW